MNSLQYVSLILTYWIFVNAARGLSRIVPYARLREYDRPGEQVTCMPLTGCSPALIIKVLHQESSGAPMNILTRFSSTSSWPNLPAPFETDGGMPDLPPAAGNDTVEQRALPAVKSAPGRTELPSLLRHAAPFTPRPSGARAPAAAAGPMGGLVPGIGAAIGASIATAAGGAFTGAAAGIVSGITAGTMLGGLNSLKMSPLKQKPVETPEQKEQRLKEELDEMMEGLDGRGSIELEESDDFLEIDGFRMAKNRHFTE